MWIESLKPGDKVIISSRYRKTISVVERITPTGRLVIDGKQFRPNGQRITGDSYNKDILIEANEENLKVIYDERERYRISTKIAETNFKTLSIEKLKKIMEILESDK